MEIMVEKEKRKKGSKISWWFLPRIKQSEPGTVHVTLPFGKSNKKEKIRPTASDGDTAANGFHGNSTHLVDVGKEENPELTELETTRLDMETFTNNLWIEFENELKGVWPSTNNWQSHNSSTVITPSSSASEKITEKNASHSSQTAIPNKCCLGNSKVNVKCVTMEKTKNDEQLNCVVKGKPPLPTPLSSAQKSRGKIALKMSKKNSLSEEEEEEVNDPSFAFDKFRQITKQGREPVAKPVQELNNMELPLQKANEEDEPGQEKVASPTVRIGDRSGDNSWSSAPSWNRFEENYAGKIIIPTITSDKTWAESSRSLVGYLETDIDTFHSREVIRVTPSTTPLTSNGDISNVGLNFGSNVKRHRPVKLKTQSMFNLMDGSDRHPHVEQNSSLVTPEMDVINEDLTSTNSSRAKSMEFLLKAENKVAVQAPENRLMHLKVTPVAHRNGGTPETKIGESRSMSEHEERIWRSLHKLNLPEWYTNSRLNRNKSSEYLRREGDERRSLRWEDFRNRSTSSSSIYSGGNDSSKGLSSVTINKHVTTPHWRVGRSSRESLVQSPSSPTSSIQIDKTIDNSGQNYYHFGMSRWGSSRLSTNSSRSSSPTSGLNSSSNYFRSSLKHQPYLGWRSSEKLATKENEKGNFYRSAAERLSKGPGYYALRFGVYNNHNRSNGGESDLSLV